MDGTLWDSSDGVAKSWTEIVNKEYDKERVITDKEAKAKKKLDGVIYNIPGKGMVTVKGPGKTYYNKELQITQFGETEVLLDNLFNKKVNTRVIFNPITGGIMKIDKD